MVGRCVVVASAELSLTTIGEAVETPDAPAAGEMPSNVNGTGLALAGLTVFAPWAEFAELPWLAAAGRRRLRGGEVAFWPSALVHAVTAAATARTPTDAVRTRLRLTPVRGGRCGMTCSHSIPAGHHMLATGSLSKTQLAAAPLHSIRARAESLSMSLIDVTFERSPVDI